MQASNFSKQHEKGLLLLQNHSHLLEQNQNERCALTCVPLLLEALASDVLA